MKEYRRYKNWDKKVRLINLFQITVFNINLNYMVYKYSYDIQRAKER